MSSQPSAAYSTSNPDISVSETQTGADRTTGTAPVILFHLPAFDTAGRSGKIDSYLEDFTAFIGYERPFVPLGHYLIQSIVRVLVPLELDNVNVFFCLYQDIDAAI